MSSKWKKREMVERRGKKRICGEEDSEGEKREE